MRFSTAIIGLTLALAAGLSGCATAPSPSPDPYADRIYKGPPPPAPSRPYPPGRSASPAPRSASAGGAWFPPGGRISSRWTDIVIHHSATDVGGAVRFDQFHRNEKGWDELGYHFVIGNGTDTPDGAIEVGSRWKSQKHGAHCKTPNNYYNDHGIGICLVGNFDKSSPSRAQLASLKRLTEFLIREARISPSRVHTHGEITHSTACAGRNFPISGFRRSVQLTASSHGRY